MIICLGVPNLTSISKPTVITGWGIGMWCDFLQLNQATEPTHDPDIYRKRDKNLVHGATLAVRVTQT